MAMTRQCEQCGKEFVAQRASRRFCGSSCRVHHSQGRKSRLQPASPPTSEVAGRVEATEAELRRVGRLDTPLGQQALFLAQSMAGESGSALASLSREWRATLAEATANAAAAADPVDQLRERRAARLA